MAKDKKNPAAPTPIVYWNRKKQCEEVENVYGSSALNWVYGTPSGQKLAEKFLSRSFCSQVYGSYQSTSLSGRKIAPFIQAFSIQMDEYEEKKYKTFNDFFIRKFRPDKRPFASDPRSFPAFAEARYLAYEQILPHQSFPVKGTALSAAGLLANSEMSKEFEGGPLFLARLCPTDYHRFHFPDEGQVLKSYTVPGRLHSVNPVALKYKNEIFITNERQVNILQTKNLGLLAYIEVGAVCVGKIVQNYGGKKDFNRGDEKGYFLFGGSTVIVLGQKGQWKPDADLLHQTSLKRETFVQLGEQIGMKCR